MLPDPDPGRPRVRPARGRAAFWYVRVVTWLPEPLPAEPDKSWTERVADEHGRHSRRLPPGRRARNWAFGSRIGGPLLGRGRFRGRAWLLLTVPPFGLTIWVLFLYIGLRARRRQWLVWAAVYAALVAVYLALDTPAKPGGTAMGVAAGLGLVAWLAGGAHAFAISGDAARRIGARTDPALDAARTRIERRALGRRLLATQPALAKEIGLGRPDKPGADDYGLIDVNHASRSAIATLPGVTDGVARGIVQKRAEVGGFSSAEDLGLVLDLPPATVDEMRDVAIFIPD